MANTGTKKHSIFDKQDVTQGLNVLYTPPNFTKEPAKCIDIIAVPGLGADMTHTWIHKGPDKKGKWHWLKDDQMLPNVIPNARISVFGYRSQWFGKDAVQTDIKAIANELLESIQEERGVRNVKRPIIFIGHSLGGLVVARAVVDGVLRRDEFPDVVECIASCVFLGTPFRGSPAQPYAKLLGIAGDAIGGIAIYNNLLKILKHGSPELDDLAHEFLGVSRKMFIHLVCYYETVKSSGTVIASKESSIFEGHENHPCDRTHEEMNKFDGPKDAAYRALSNKLRRIMLNEWPRIQKLRNSSQVKFDDKEVKVILDSLESINPKKDLEAIRKGQGSQSWIPKDPDYQKWKDYPTHQNIWISGGPGKGKSKAAISIVDDLDSLINQVPYRDDSPALTYFFCDERDVDKSKAINVLKTLIWQLLSTKRFLARYFSTENDSQKGSLESASLPELWRSLTNACLDRELGTVYFVVAGLDQIDSASRKVFLDLLISWNPPVMEDEDQSPPVIKWVFLGAAKPDIEMALRGAIRINLDNGSNLEEQQKELHSIIGHKIREISMKNGYSRSLEYYTKSYIAFRADGKSNYDWVNLVCKELEYDKPQYNYIRRHLESLPSDLQPMYEHLSKRISNSPDDKLECSKEILRCLLLVDAPPTLFELAVIADLPIEQRRDEEAIKEHVAICGAFIDIFEDYEGISRVRTSNTSAHTYLDSKSEQWLSMPSKQIQHGIIALRCLEYVRSHIKEKARDHELGEYQDNEEEQGADEEETANSDDGEHEDNEAVDDTLAYPYMKWIEHALKATPDIIECFDLHEEFWELGSEDRRKWAAFFHENDGDFDENFSTMGIAAYFGYNDFADSVLKNEVNLRELRMPDSSGNYPLYWACAKGHIKMVDKLCNAGADVNGYQNDDEAVGLSPLHGAVLSGKMEIVEYLLTKGAIVDTPNLSHGTALYLAVEKDYAQIAKQLMKNGANPNSIGGDDVLPLNAAAHNGNLELIQLLVHQGSYIDCDIEYSWGNALGVASYHGHPKVVKYLLSLGAAINKTDARGFSPLKSSVSTGARGNDEIVRLLLQYDSDPESHNLALESAVENNLLQCVKVIIERCPLVSHRNPFETAAKNGLTGILKILTGDGIPPEVKDKALYEATDKEHFSTVELLLNMGASPNAEGTEFGNALQAAAYDGNEDILRLLLDRGANPNQKYGDDTYGTALQAAAFQGTLANVQLLVELGALINFSKVGLFGNPLYAACSTGRDEIVEFLISRGADVNAAGGEYDYSIIIASENGYQNCVELLVKAKADVNVRGGPDGVTPLITAAAQLPVSTVKLLLANGARLHDVDNDNDNALLMAAASGDAECVAFLLGKGADIHHIGKWGGALHRAAASGTLECVQILLNDDNDIDVNQKGGKYYTPLQVAASFGSSDIVEALLGRGANVHSKGGTYFTALQAAAASDDEATVRLLLDKGAKTTDRGGRHGSPLHAAVRVDASIELIDLLLEHGADINDVDDVTGSVLTLAARRAADETVLHLIEKGADINLAGGKYGNFIQAAAYISPADTIKSILKYEPDLNFQGGYYGSALAAASSYGDNELVDLLLSQKQKPTQHILDEALYTAVHYRESDTVNLLLEHGASVVAEGCGRDNCIIGRYGSILDALESEMSEEETAQRKFDGDRDDVEIEEEEESDDEDEDEDEKSEDDYSSQVSDDDEEVDQADKIEIYIGIKNILTTALDALNPQKDKVKEPAPEHKSFEAPKQEPQIVQIVTQGEQQLETSKEQPQLGRPENTDRTVSEPSIPSQPSIAELPATSTTKSFSSTNRYKRPTREEIEARPFNTTVAKSDPKERPARYSSDYSVESPVDTRAQLPGLPPIVSAELESSPPKRHTQPIPPPKEPPVRTSVSQPAPNQPVYAAYPGSQQALPPRRQISPENPSGKTVISRRPVATPSPPPATYPTNPALMPQGLQLPNRPEVAGPPSPSVYGQFSPYSGAPNVASVIAASRPASSSISTPGYFPPQPNTEYAPRPARASVSSSSYSPAQPAVNTSRPSRATVSSANNLSYPRSSIPERFVQMPSPSPPSSMGSNNPSRIEYAPVSTSGYPSPQPVSTPSSWQSRPSVSSSQTNPLPYPGASTTDYFGASSQGSPAQPPYNNNGAPYTAYRPSQSSSQNQNQKQTQNPNPNQTQNQNTNPNQTQGLGYGRGAPQQPRPNQQQQSWNTYRG
ncbi:hypothetical protein HYFRA_00010926 [Hymenoscyphus fraxineus]|uniref:DUF676 domain-containing protein n=1 Tax=Hymenoscyphus fraxineus TaxID=746836 RepID=A0A9N9L249_9HELO|nr:hypothetical protein HYFRA_00010926 [Hymenoscyphus fraxineus]